MVSTREHIEPSLLGSFRQIAELENDYRVRIGMWLTMRDDVDGTGYFEVHMSGSGDIYDHIPPPLGHTKARVISAFNDPFASALQSCIDQLRTTLERYAGYLTLPPNP